MADEEKKAKTEKEKEVGSKPSNPTGVLPRAAAAAITSPPNCRHTGKRSASAKLSAIESMLSAVANSIAPYASLPQR